MFFHNGINYLDIFNFEKNLPIEVKILELHLVLDIFHTVLHFIQQKIDKTNVWIAICLSRNWLE